MSEVIVTVEGFRGALKEFCDEMRYSDCLVTRFLTQAQAYISTTNYRIKPAIRLLLIQLMAAHLISLSEIDPETGIVSSMADGGKFEQNATIGDVSVNVAIPSGNKAFELWINSTGYGRQYWAILQAHSATPLYFTGNPQPFGIR